MNQLPDAFLVTVVMDGGPAMGLAPTMPPFRGNLNDGQARQIVVFLRTLARPAFRPELAKPLVTPARAPVQPIFFNHVIHAGSFQIPCQYCHADARRGAAAGVPSVQRCMGCHAIIGAQDNPEIRKIHDYWKRREPIPWIRVFAVPEFTFFAHKPHIRAGVECQTCHGPIERMPASARPPGSGHRSVTLVRPAPLRPVHDGCASAPPIDATKGTPRRGASPATIDRPGGPTRPPMARTLVYPAKPWRPRIRRQAIGMAELGRFRIDVAPRVDLAQEDAMRERTSESVAQVNSANGPGREMGRLCRHRAWRVCAIVRSAFAGPRPTLEELR